MGKFSRAFIDLRERSGFKTAYSFYSSNGGRRAFPFTYASYLKIERGARLPSPSEILLLFRNLRRGPSVLERQDLIRAWLRDVSADESTYQELFAVLSVAAEEADLLPAIRDMHGRLSYNIAPAQMRALTETREATACFVLLANSPDSVSLEEIAQSVGASEERCLAALRALLKKKLVRSIGADGWQARHPGRCYQMPSAPEPLALMAEHLHATARRHGEGLLDARTATRLKLPAVLAAVGDLQKVLDACASLSQSRTSLGPDTPLYLLEARVSRVLSFGRPG